MSVDDVVDAGNILMARTYHHSSAVEKRWPSFPTAHPICEMHVLCRIHAARLCKCRSRAGFSIHKFQVSDDCGDPLPTPAMCARVRIGPAASRIEGPREGHSIWVPSFDPSATDAEPVARPYMNSLVISHPHMCVRACVRVAVATVKAAAGSR